MKKQIVIIGMLISFIIFHGIISKANNGQNLCEVTASYMAPWNGYCKGPNEQFLNDAEILLNTIYSDNEEIFLTKLATNKNFSATNMKTLREIVKTRKNFLKRLFITMGHFGVKIIDSKLKVIKKGKKKGQQKEKSLDKKSVAAEIADIEKEMTEAEQVALLKDEQDDPAHNWPYTLASVFGHGGRMIIEIDTEKDKKFTIRQLLNLLITGNRNSSGPAAVLKQRAAGSHGISYQTVNNKLIAMEVKVQFNVFRHLRNIGRHWGFNLPLGGIGNPDPFGKIIGPSGTRYEPKILDSSEIKDLGKLWKQKGKFYSMATFHKPTAKYNYQHGHFYIFLRDYNRGIFKKEHVRSIMMIGLEACAPDGTNMWGHVHTWLSAFNSPKEPGVTGGKKWKQLKIENNDMKIPATYGGKRIYIDNTKKVDELEEVFKQVLSADEPTQKAFFRALLYSTASEAKQVFKNY